MPVLCEPESSDIPRARFEPSEVVALTLDFYRRNYIEGLFLSSGVLKSPDHTMEQLVAVARSLREEHRFGGYIHLKAAPGVARELLELAGLFADRVSVNVELPTSRDLDVLAPEKTMPAVEAAMGSLRDASRITIWTFIAIPSCPGRCVTAKSRAPRMHIYPSCPSNVRCLCYARQLANAAPAICTRLRPKPFSAKVLKTPAFS